MTLINAEEVDRVVQSSEGLWFDLQLHADSLVKLLDLKLLLALPVGAWVASTSRAATWWADGTLHVASATTE